MGTWVWMTEVSSLIEILIESTHVEGFQIEQVPIVERKQGILGCVATTPPLV